MHAGLRLQSPCFRGGERAQAGTDEPARLQALARRFHRLEGSGQPGLVRLRRGLRAARLFGPARQQPARMVQNPPAGLDLLPGGGDVAPALLDQFVRKQPD